MKLPNTLMEKLSERYNLNKKSQMVLKTYLEAPDDEKEAIENSYNVGRKSAKRRQGVISLPF